MVTRTKPLKRDRLYTEEEFMSLPDDGKHYELWGGRLSEVMSPSAGHGAIAARISQKLLNYTDEYNNGLVCSNDTSFRLAPGTLVGADVAFITAEKLPVDLTKEVPFAPDLAIEVISPSDIYNKVDEKIEKYLNAGTRLVWSINPRRNEVIVYRQGEDHGTIFGIKDELEGEGVLPGFKLKVNDIFPKK